MALASSPRVIRIGTIFVFSLYAYALYKMLPIAVNLLSMLHIVFGWKT